MTAKQIPPNPPLTKGGEGKALKLADALAWLDYCLGETAAAMEAVRGVALEAVKTQRSTGGVFQRSTGGMPVLLKQFHEICELAARINTLRWRARRWIMGDRG